MNIYTCAFVAIGITIDGDGDRVRDNVLSSVLRTDAPLVHPFCDAEMRTGWIEKYTLDHLACRSGAWKELRQERPEERVNEPKIRLLC